MLVNVYKQIKMRLDKRKGEEKDMNLARSSWIFNKIISLVLIACQTSISGRITKGVTVGSFNYSPCSNMESKKVGYSSPQRIMFHSDKTLSGGVDGNMELEEEDEDEDVDFNPFLRETPSPEASSSLSSENEDLGNDPKQISESSMLLKDNNTSTKPIREVRLSRNRDSENEEYGVLLQNENPDIGNHRKGDILAEQKNKSSSTNQLEIGFLYPDDKTEEELLGQTMASLPDLAIPRKPTIRTQRVQCDDADFEDSICRRTRARYSLADLTLDELETFLQESDEEDYLQNVDEEEEYRKFLEAVAGGLAGDDNKNQGLLDKEDIDDEDETDADFEIEIEEALDSDLDESTRGKGIRGSSHRPETRKKQRQKASTQAKEKFLGLAHRPLRPLLPLAANMQAANCSDLEQNLVPDGVFTSLSKPDINYGFTAPQIGQLYCLIHEHLQLLIQVFSLSVLDPSWQHIASEVKKMILQMVEKRGEVLAWKKVPYPDFCFRPPFICPSVSPFSQLHLIQEARDPSIADFRWVPVVLGPLQSVLDVAPLGFVEGFLVDTEAAVLEYKQQCVEAVNRRSHLEKEPLFPFPSLPFVDESSLHAHPRLRKTKAASLVEKAKMQTVAPVHKGIVKLVQRFFPLFNSALFPHKPPLAATANRVLFTDAEDELLAMGLMTYNNDWKAIQRRFLPCKSKKQIHIRQKNRSSAKAPENSIKAVRRMKNSPLTPEEMACIQEGLKVSYQDWTAVWKYFVPHRDPSLLPRQWRTALGTQKSYRSEGALKEKRRLYEASRRKRSKAFSNGLQNVGTDDGENDSGDDDMDGEDEAYVHEAFLADWRPSRSDLMASELPAGSEKAATSVNKSIEILQGNALLHQVPATLMPSGNLQPVSPFTSASYGPSSNRSVSDYVKKPARNPISLRPYRSRKNSSVQLVKLAPDLPPVNLPASVRVISQSAFQSYRCGSPCKTNIIDKQRAAPRLSKPTTVTRHANFNISRGGNGTGEVISRQSHTAKSGISSSGDPKPHSDQAVYEETSNEADLQMHPLLFQVPKEGYLPYQPMNYKTTTTASTFGIFPGNPLHISLDLLFKTGQAVGSVNGSHPAKSNEISANLCTSGFHPLLQRANNATNDVGPISSQLLAPSNVCPTGEAQRNHDSLANSGPHEMECELDLEIHLSTGTSKEKSSEGRDVRIMTHDKENSQTDLYTGERSNAHVIEGCEIEDVTNIHREDHLDDHPLQEVVMEQEELSDSEEEVPEHVEFECEEMDDSEGEGSDCEHLVGIPNKEQSTELEEEEIILHENRDKQRKPRNPLPRRKVCVAKDDKASNSSGLMGSKNSRRRLIQRNPDLCTPGPSYSDHKCEEDLSRDGAGKHFLRGHLSRHGRSGKRKPNTAVKSCSISKKNVASRKKSRKCDSRTNSFSPTVDDSSGHPTADSGGCSHNFRSEGDVQQMGNLVCSGSSPAKTEAKSPGMTVPIDGDGKAEDV